MPDDIQIDADKVEFFLDDFSNSETIIFGLHLLKQPAHVTAEQLKALEDKRRKEAEEKEANRKEELEREKLAELLAKYGEASR